MVLGIHFTGPEHIILVENIKYKTEIMIYLKKYKKEFKINCPEVNLEKILNDWENVRRIPPYPCVPPEIWHWIRPRWQKENIDPKHDNYGVPAGKIDQDWINQYPKDYFDYAIAAEFVEETEKIIVRATTNSAGDIIRISLFKRLMLLLSRNRETGLFDYEHYFFHVIEADGEWAKNGFPEETGPPEIIPIKNLYPPGYRDKIGKWPENGIDLYSKHGFGVKACLRELVHNQGKEEYRPALAHMEKFFPREAKDVGLIKELEAEPTFDLSDDERWENFTKGKGIKKLGGEK